MGKYSSVKDSLSEIVAEGIHTIVLHLFLK